MTIEEKRELIRQNKDAIIVYINAILDAIYGLTDKYFDENGEILAFLQRDEKLEQFIKECKKDCNYYENIRKKIADNDFELSLLEINRIGLACMFTNIRLEKIISNMKQNISQTKSLYSSLIDKESRDIDFSKNI